MHLAKQVYPLDPYFLISLTHASTAALQRQWTVPHRRVEASASSRDLGLDVPRLFGDLDMDFQTDMQRQLTDMQRSFQQMEQEVRSRAASPSISAALQAYGVARPGLNAVWCCS